MDGRPVDLLASLPNFILGVTEGQWAAFTFKLASGPGQGAELTVTINGVDLYQGPLPEGGPRSGAFQVGFRENHSGAPGPGEGTWVDTLSFDDL